MELVWAHAQQGTHFNLQAVPQHAAAFLSARLERPGPKWATMEPG